MADFPQRGDDPYGPKLQAYIDAIPAIRHTAAQWTSLNPVLELDRFGVETDTGKLKNGDGATAWNSLGYVAGSGGGGLPAGGTVGQVVTNTGPGTGDWENASGGLPETPLSLAHGGTAGTTAAAAKTSFGIPGVYVSDYSSLNNAIAALADDDTLVLPKGDISVTGPLTTITKRVNIVGLGPEQKSRLVATSGVGSGAVLTFAPTATMHHVRLADFAIDLTAASSAIGIKLDGSLTGSSTTPFDNVDVERVKIRGGSVGFDLFDMAICRFVRCDHYNPGRSGFRINGTDTTHKNVGMWFDDCTVYETSGSQTALAGWEVLVARDIHWNGSYAIRTPGIAATLQWGYFINRAAGIGQGGFFFSGNTESDGIEDGSTAGSSAGTCAALYMKNASRVIVNGMWLSAAPTGENSHPAIWIDGGSDYEIDARYSGNPAIVLRNAPDTLVFRGLVVSTATTAVFDIDPASAPTNLSYADLLYPSATPISNDTTGAFTGSIARATSSATLVNTGPGSGTSKGQAYINPDSGKKIFFHVESGATGNGAFLTDSGATVIGRVLQAGGFGIGTGNVKVRAGSGSPEGVVTDYRGSVWLRTDGGAATAIYLKETGDNTNTGWIAYATGAGALLAANNLSDVANAATARTNLGAAPTASPTFTGTVTLPADATTGLQAVTYQQMVALLNATEAKAEVQYASAAALPANTYSNGSSGVGATLTATANGALVIDGVTITTQVGARVLVTAEAAPANNGWYTITQVGVAAVSPYILTRATDADQAAELGAGYLAAVKAASGLSAGTNDGKVYISIAPAPFVVGTSSLTFSQVGSTYSAGTGIGLSGTTFSIDRSTTDTWYQPLDSDLTAIAALTTTSFGRSLLTLNNLPGAYAANISLTGGTPLTVTHNLGTVDVLAVVYDESVSPPLLAGWVGVKPDTTNSVIITSSTTLATGRVVVLSGSGPQGPTGATGPTGGTRVGTPATHSTSPWVIDASLYDVWEETALAANVSISAPMNSPVNGQKLLMRIKASSAFTITWNSIFRSASGLALPTASVNGVLLLGHIYNSTDTKWDFVAQRQY